MTDKEKPAGAGDADGLHDLPAQTGQDIEQLNALLAIGNLNRALKGLDLALLEREVGAILTAIGDAERDDEQRRRHREFAVRLLHEPLQSVHLAPPPQEDGEYRVTVTFRDQPADVPYFIGSSLGRALALADRLHRLKGCPLEFLPAWEPEAAA